MNKPLKEKVLVRLPYNKSWQRRPAMPEALRIGVSGVAEERHAPREATRIVRYSFIALIRVDARQRAASRLLFE